MRSRGWGVTIQVAEEIKKTKRVAVSQSILIFFQNYKGLAKPKKLGNGV